jgi:hypothetical protein
MRGLLTYLVPKTRNPLRGAHPFAKLAIISNSVFLQGYAPHGDTAVAANLSIHSFKKFVGLLF